MAVKKGLGKGLDSLIPAAPKGEAVSKKKTTSKVSTVKKEAVKKAPVKKEATKKFKVAIDYVLINS